ncbi:hypothetical protein ANN_15089 [Periplaneta americana]|uniref:Phospholipase B-like n=1 Tax=Periplaneta americana TaxID=6978 RepID=A0ABQ8SZP8_PERAM|nr:hypothetical protein ANN_15089 [Periplaneta americana]
MSWHGACASGTSRVLSVASLHWLKLDVPILAPAEFEVRWMNIQGDLEDLVAAFDSDNPNIREPSIVPGSGSCAALIKIIPNPFDLYTAHSTCSSYQSMLRLQKKYIFPFRVLGNTSRVIPGFAMSFSSYPGRIQSGDDFYITSEKLTILRTTTGNNNHSLYQHVVPERQMLAQFRAVIAGRLADCGRCWCKLFSQYNSGTCNSQWMVVDYKLFEIQARTSELSKHLLWVLEQLPGYIRYEDNTHILNEQSYWPSYSIPYFSDIFKLGANAKLVEQYGSWFTYENNPRALIFRRDHRGVVNAARMMSFMRSNNYTQDSLSRCNCTPGHNAALAVAPRGDLNPVDGRYPLASLGFRLHGATDMKLTTTNLVSSFQFIAYAGPAYNKNIPPFTWTSVPSEHAKHLGQPDVWQFGPVLHRWDWN